MFGKLTWAAIPFHDPIVMVTSECAGTTRFVVGQYSTHP